MISNDVYLGTYIKVDISKMRFYDENKVDPNPVYGCPNKSCQQYATSSHQLYTFCPHCASKLEMVVATNEPEELLPEADLFSEKFNLNGMGFDCCDMEYSNDGSGATEIICIYPTAFSPYPKEIKKFNLMESNEDTITNVDVFIGDIQKALDSFGTNKKWIKLIDLLKENNLTYTTHFGVITF